MKRLFVLVISFCLIASSAFAAVGISIAGLNVGTATNLNFPSGTSYTSDGSTYTFATLANAAAAITSGTINGAVIGGSSAAAGSFTTLTASSTLAVTGNATVGGTLGVTGNTTITGTLGVTGAVTNSSTVTGPGGGYGIYTLRTRVTTANINSGTTLLASVTGRKYRLIYAKIIAYGGSMAATANATGVAIKGTQSSGVVQLFTVNLAQLTRSAVNMVGTASTAILADGASFVACDATTAITVAAVGGTDLITATGADVEVTYAIE